MKKTTTILLISILLSMATAFAQGGTTGPLTWNISDSTLTISGEGAMPDYEWSEAPWYNYQESINTCIIETGVTRIGNDAFSSCKNVTSIVIPNSVTTIGIAAFWDCSGLASITIPNSVTNIEMWAFAHCYSLTSIIIPNSVTTIEEALFWNCRNLSSVTIPCSVINFENASFYNCTSLALFTNHNPVPVEVAFRVFLLHDIKDCILQVPMESVSAYQNAEMWKYFKSIVSIEVDVETIEKDAITIYPNPTRGELQVTSDELRVTSIEIFDVYGRKQSFGYAQLPKAESRKQKGERNMEIDISMLSAGLYFVKITTEKGIITKKIIKQ